MSELINYLSYTCLLLGSITNLIAGLGLFYFPDVFSRMHAAGITDTLGTAFILIGLMLYPGWDGATGKLLLIFLFALITSPTISFALAATALKKGTKPILDSHHPETTGKGDSSKL